MQTNSVVGKTASAVSRDFCRIFAEDMDALYWFSFLLTADEEKAEQCFVSGLEDCAEENRVFKEWARSWARRAILQNAIRLVQPQAEQVAVYGRMLAVSKAPDVTPFQLAAVLGLKPFERFVFVMSVLERYSDQECKTLLGCSLPDVIAARGRALKHLGAVAGIPVPHALKDGSGAVRQKATMARSA